MTDKIYLHLHMNVFSKDICKTCQKKLGQIKQIIN